MTTQDEAKGEIFNQLIAADVLTKLLNAIDKHFLNSVDKAEYMSKLVHMSRVLVMLASVYDKADRRAAVTDQACAILKEYSNVPFGQSEYVAQVVGNTSSMLEHIILRCGKLTFSAVANTYTGTPLNEDTIELKNLVNDLFNGTAFRVSIKNIIGQPDCSISIVGQVCSLLHCLCHVDLLCYDDARVVEHFFSFVGLPDLLRLLMREAQALPCNEIEKIPAALHLLSCIMGILRSLLSLPANLIQQYNVAVDSDLSVSLTSLVQWVERIGVDHLAPYTEVQRLLQVLVNESVRILHGAHLEHWPHSNAALRDLLIAVQPLGLGAAVDILRTTIREKDVVLAGLQVEADSIAYLRCYLSIML